MPNTNHSNQDRLRSMLRDVPDFPKPGILFKDITPVLKSAWGFSTLIEETAQSLKSFSDFDHIVGIESRGFILGSALALTMKKGFLPVRKKGKLPWQKVTHSYELEYGTDEIEMHFDAVQPGDKILIVDDVLATGGTANAAAELVKKVGGRIVAFSFFIELDFLNGRSKLEKTAPIQSLIRIS